MWRFTGKHRPDFAETPGPGRESVWDFPRPPRIDRPARRVVVSAGGHELARTARPLRVCETASPPTFAAGQGERTRRPVVPGSRRRGRGPGVAKGRETRSCVGNMQSASDTASSHRQRAVAQAFRPRRGQVVPKPRPGAGRTGAPKAVAKERVRPAAGAPGRIHERHATLLLYFPQRRRLAAFGRGTRTVPLRVEGAARYWALSNRPDEPAAWSYPDPSPAFAELRDCIAFYPGRVECTLDGELVRPQPGHFIRRMDHRPSRRAL